MASGLAGGGLAACFLLPALGLREATNAKAMDLSNAWHSDLLFFTPLGEDRVFVLSRMLIWGSAGLTLALGLWPLRRMGRVVRQPGPWRGALVLLLGAFALITVLTLPLWLALPQLAAVQFPGGQRDRSAWQQRCPWQGCGRVRLSA